MVTKNEKAGTYLIYGLIILVFIIIGVVLYTQILNAEYSDITETNKWEMTLSHPENKVSSHGVFCTGNVLPIFIIFVGIITFIVGWFCFRDDTEENEEDDDL